jgi:hypothetical protein
MPELQFADTRGRRKRRGNLRSGAEHEDHYEGVREADFGAVDDAIAYAFN